MASTMEKNWTLTYNATPPQLAHCPGMAHFKIVDMVMEKTYTNEDQCFLFSSFDVMVVMFFSAVRRK